MFCPSPDAEQNDVRRSLDFSHKKWESFDDETQSSAVYKHNVDSCNNTPPPDVSTPLEHGASFLETPYRQPTRCRRRRRRPSSTCTETSSVSVYSALTSPSYHAFSTPSAKGLRDNAIAAPAHERKAIRLQ